MSVSADFFLFFDPSSAASERKRSGGGRRLGTPLQPQPLHWPGGHSLLLVEQGVGHLSDGQQRTPGRLI